MLSTVEVRIGAGELADVMRRMRSWLDRRKIMQHDFRQSACPGGLVLHLEFDSAEAAAEFSGKFGGRLLQAPGACADGWIVAGRQAGKPN